MAWVLCGIPLVTASASVSGSISNYVIFSINVQDFARPELSAATLKKLIAIHEKYQVPVDFYLTGTMADLYVSQAPQLVAMIKRSPLVAVSYHVRPPLPYYTQYDWLGLRDMNPDRQRETILRYESHGLDLATGQPTEKEGGYQKLIRMFGYAPTVVSAQADAGSSRVVSEVFKELGARMFAVHGRPPNLGDQKEGLFLRPEHVDVKLFQRTAEKPADIIEGALAEARQGRGTRAPYFVGVKMHDNDFFAATSAWVTTYIQRNRRPPWELSVKAPLKSERDQATLWSLYEATVAYVADASPRIAAVNAPMVLAGLEKGGQPVSNATSQPGVSPSSVSTVAVVSQFCISGTMHIESRRQSWPDPDALLAFFKRATQAGRVGGRTNGMRWSIGADMGWLAGGPRVAEIIKATETMGVEWDIHAHQASDRPECFKTITRMGGHPNHVCSGLLLSEMDALRKPVNSRDGSTTWQAEVLWGTAYRPLHGAGADDNSFGLWRPKSEKEYLTHDPAGVLIAAGGGDRTLSGIEQYAKKLASAKGPPRVSSATVMVSPRMLTVARGTEGIEDLEKWARRVGGLPIVRWANIRETAEAWKAAGAIPSREDSPESNGIKRPVRGF
jgi:hypothetical protein